MSPSPWNTADVPRIIFGGKVGYESPLFALYAITGVQFSAGMPGDIDIANTIASPFRMILQIILSDSVTTLQDQTYVANAIDIGESGQELLLTTDIGSINIHAGQNINHPFMPGVKAVNGTQITLKGKFSRGTANSFRDSGVKFKQDSRGGFVDAALATALSKFKDKVSIEYEATVDVGAVCVKADNEGCKI